MKRDSGFGNGHQYGDGYGTGAGYVDYNVLVH